MSLCFVIVLSVFYELIRTKADAPQVSLFDAVLHFYVQ